MALEILGAAYAAYNIAKYFYEGSRNHSLSIAGASRVIGTNIIGHTLGVAGGAIGGAIGSAIQDHGRIQEQKKQPPVERGTDAGKLQAAREWQQQQWDAEGNGLVVPPIKS